MLSSTASNVVSSSPQAGLSVVDGGIDSPVTEPKKVAPFLAETVDTGPYFSRLRNECLSVLEPRMRSALDASPHQKALQFETALADFRILPELPLIADSIVPGDPKLTYPHCEATSHYLAVLALKQLLGDRNMAGAPQVGGQEQEALAVVRSLVEMDALDGQLGYLPLRARLNSDTGAVEVKDARTKSNSYVQILFSYALADKAFGSELKKEVGSHVSAIVKHILEHDFRLVNPQGKKVTNLAPSPIGLFNPSRYLDALLVIESGIHLSNDPELISSLVELRKKYIGTYEAPKALPKAILNSLLHVEFKSPVGEHMIPTVSSSVLNTFKLSALIMLTEQNQPASAYYSSIFAKLCDKLAPQHNPIVDMLGVLTKVIDTPGVSVLTEKAAIMLQTFSTDTMNLGAYDMSSYYSDRVLREKLTKSYPRADEVLPVFARPWSPFIWKMNAYTCHHSHPNQSPKAAANGLDYLMAYYLTQCVTEQKSLLRPNA